MPAPSPFDHALIPRVQEALGPDYALGPMIGRGGFGLVFSARELRLKRDVAVKILRPELAAPVLRERFRREAEAAAGLRHPGIIPIFTIGERDDLIWFVMPLIEGETVSARIQREGRLPIGEARRILAETAQALAVAHAAGIIHRDLKPDNILLERPDSRVILTDFGIAKSLATTNVPGQDGPLTGTGFILGTPEYMSPEQAGGEEVIDHRSDLYSLGVVGFEMLTGTLPFDGASPGAVLSQQLTTGPTAVAKRRPECPPALAAAVDRCLALAPEDRWASALDFAGSLSGGSIPVPAISAAEPGTGPGSEVKRFRRLALIAGAVLLMSLTADVIFGRIATAPFVGLVAASVLATRYGRLWTAGHSWREVLGRPQGVRERVPKTSSGESPHPIVQQARSDRAAIRRILSGLPRSEQALVPDLSRQLDELVARIEDQAGRLFDPNTSAERPGRRTGGSGTQPPAEDQRQKREGIERQMELDSRRIAKAYLTLRVAESRGMAGVSSELTRSLAGNDQP